MRYHALASDYDGTLATNGRLDDDVRAGLEALRATGRKMILVTGRRIPDLQGACPDLSTFDIVVAENGAVLYWPATGEVRLLVEPPPALFADTLERRGVPDVARGHVIVATWQPHEAAVLEVIRELGLEMQVIFNKGAVMVLPSGVNKGTGLRAALDAMQLSPRNVVAVGDAENDHALLAACECGAAVANALPMLKDRADIVTVNHHGAGVLELAQRLIADDLLDAMPFPSRHDLTVGVDAASRPVHLPAYGSNILLVGTSGGGKSTFATGFFERLDEHGYQYCILDPEGDYDELPRAIVVGGQKEKPVIEQLPKLLEKPAQNVVVNLLGVGLEDRPTFFKHVVPRLLDARAHSGRPHWIIVDEAHHVAPATVPAPPFETRDVTNFFFITVHPEHLSSALRDMVDIVVVIGTDPAAALREFATASGLVPPGVERASLESGEALLWWPRREAERAYWLRTIPPETERRRHIRKYAEGELPPERSFYFRGPEDKLNLRARNLTAFVEIGAGVDDETWRHHLGRGEYSEWVGRAIKDRELADEVRAIERASRASGTTNDSRRAIKEAIERRYTGPA